MAKKKVFSAIEEKKINEEADQRARKIVAERKVAFAEQKEREEHKHDMEYQKARARYYNFLANLLSALTDLTRTANVSIREGLESRKATRDKH